MYVILIYWRVVMKRKFKVGEIVPGSTILTKLGNQPFSGSTILAVSDALEPFVKQLRSYEKARDLKIQEVGTTKDGRSFEVIGEEPTRLMNEYVEELFDVDVEIEVSGVLDINEFVESAKDISAADLALLRFYGFFKEEAVAAEEAPAGEEAPTGEES